MVTIGSVVHVGDVLAEIDQKELGDEVASATAELARLREEDARMTRLDEDEARAKAETPGAARGRPSVGAWSSIGRDSPPTGGSSPATRA